MVAMTATGRTRPTVRFRVRRPRARRRHVVDRDARFRDVPLFVVGKERKRVTAESDVLRALPGEHPRERRGVVVFAKVAYQLAVYPPGSAEHADLGCGSRVK